MYPYKLGIKIFTGNLINLIELLQYCKMKIAIANHILEI